MIRVIRSFPYQYSRVGVPESGLGNVCADRIECKRYRFLLKKIARNNRLIHDSIAR